ncbi:MAG: hypothetical protein ACREN2_07945 [Candidatus Dormibacteria bacterium]
MSSTASNLWIAGLAIAVVVLAVATVLLTVVLRVASQIDDGAKEIWTVGKQVANATVELSLLRRTNQLVADVLEASTGILANARRISRHARSCPGCPRCVLSGQTGGVR